MRVCTACATETDESGRFCPACGAALAAAAPSVPTADHRARPDTGAHSLVGHTVDGFTFEAVIGGGAFGTVFRGRQHGLERPVALKVPTFEILADPTLAKRFGREARSAAKIAHPGVVAIYGVGELSDGRPYLAMQLIDGVPLDKILEEGPVPALRAVRIIRDLASALAETHLQQVVHRDLKPANVMWRRDRHGDDRITIVDFGIAVAKPGNADATRLTTNGLIGTPHYMSPEQAQGENIDHRSDIYALGCILFELVTADTPFAGSGMEVLLAHMGRPIPTPSDRNPDVPPAVDRVVRRLMAKRPHERPQTADEVVEMLDEAIAELTAPSSDASTVSAARTLRKKKPTFEPTIRAKLGIQSTIPLGSSAMGDDLPAASTVDSGPRALANSRDKEGADRVSDPNLGADPATIARDAADHSAYVRTTRHRPAETGVEELPEPAPPAKRWTWLAAGIIVGGAAMFGALQLRSPGAPADASVREPSRPAAAGSGDEELTPAAGEIIGRKTMVSDDGEFTQRTTLYDPILAGVRAQTAFEVWNKLGAPFEAAELVVTLESPDGSAIGGTARASRNAKGRYLWGHVFPAPGAYVLRVFPPETHTVFTLDLTVEAR